MGQKVNPHGLRVGVIKNWDSRWFAKDNAFGDILVEDYKLRKALKEKLYASGVAKIEIERDNTGRVKINIHTAKPGMVIGKGGTEIDKLKDECKALLGRDNVAINITEVKSPDKNAQLIAENSQNVFFQIGKSYISREEGKKIDTLAEWLKANPSYSVEVVGYADKETGYTALNQKLSERRAANVKARLLAAGIAEERIVTDHKGDTVQPFGEKSAKNRVVICTLE